MASQTWPNWPWLTPFSTNTNTTITRKIRAFNEGINTEVPLFLLICLQPSHPPLTNHDRSVNQLWQWQWACPNGNPPPVPTHCRTEHPDFVTPPQPTHCPKTTPPQRQRRTLGNAHQQSLRHQEQRTQSALASILHFAPCLCKDSINWLLSQNKIFPPNIPATNTTDYSLPDKPFDSKSSILLKQINSYLSEMVLILDIALCDLRWDIDGEPLQEKHRCTANTEEANNHKTEKRTACTRKPLSTIQPDNARSAVAPQRHIMQSMTVTTLRKNICMSDADKIPWNHSVAIAATEYINKPNNDGPSWNKANPNAEKRENVFIPDTDKPPWNNPTTVDPTDWIDRLSTKGVSQNGTDLTVIRTAEKNNETAVEDADHNNETDNDNIFWGCTEDNNSIHTTTPKSDNDQENTITNATVLCRTTPPPPCQHDIGNFTTQNTHGLCQQPCDADGKPMIHKPHNYTCYEHLVASMKTKSMDIYFVQETWLEGDAFNEVINGYHIFRHNGGKGNHNFHGVAIILSPK
jgi:hypothetical protein